MRAATQEDWALSRLTFARVANFESGSCAIPALIRLTFHLEGGL